MTDTGYSTIIDAVIFLVMVSACALILGAAIQSGGRPQSVEDASLRATASSTLASMESVKIDRFEYRILGDKADAVAAACGIDPGAWLYCETTKAVLGRGSRHRTVMETAAGAAACQFDLRSGDKALRLNPLTGDYHYQARLAVDGYLRGRLDSRYAYNFTLRWVPFAGVPFEGSLSCGDPVPPGAAMASAYVTMPYRTGVTRESIEGAIGPDLANIEDAMRDRNGERVRASLGRCLANASRPMVDEVLGNTLYEALPLNDVGNPLALLAAFADNDSVGADPLLDVDRGLEDTLCGMIVLASGEPLDQLADEVMEGVEEGTMAPGDERELVVRWMGSRYNPSRARATLGVWVRTDA